MQHPVMPHGEHLRQAVHWISDRRREHVELSPWALVDEAARRFDLTASEGEWLMSTFARDA